MNLSFKGKNFFHQLFRHGARTPIECEAKMLQGISNESSYDPWGYAQLTNVRAKIQFDIIEI